MYVPFHELPPGARIWIYQADRAFTPQEAEKLEPAIREFVTQWSAHGKQLRASGTLLHNRFLILGADESAERPSGCSIDSSVKFIREVEAAYGISLLDRTLLAFKQNNEIKTIPLGRIKQTIADGEITSDTIFFDNMVTDAEALNRHWVKPAGESWLVKYF